jgi:hypothetical protein
MFTLEIGVNQEHPRVEPYDVNFRQNAEARFGSAGMKPYWWAGAVAVSFTINGDFSPGLVLSKVRTVLSTAELPDEALHVVRISVSGQLTKEAYEGLPSAHAGRCNFGIYTLGGSKPVTYMAIYPKEYPFGFEYTINSFQASAELFVVLMRISNRIVDAKDKLINHHNVAGAIAKLDDIPSYLLRLGAGIRDHWRYSMSEPGEVLAKEGQIA